MEKHYVILKNANETVIYAYTTGKIYERARVRIVY